MRLLIAEDELEISKVLKMVLEQQKYAVDLRRAGTPAK